MRLFFLILLTALSASGQRSRAGDAPVPFQRPPVETSGCPAEGTTGLLPRSGPGDFVELQRTSCFGSCPVYTVQIRADGEITWRGEQYVRVAGGSGATIDRAAARALIDKFRESGFWNLCTSYSIRVTDSSTAITTVHIGDQEKRVSDYSNTAPEWLRALATEIDTLADTHRWIHGDPRTEIVAMVRSATRPFGLPFNPIGPHLGPKPGVTALMQASLKGDTGEIQKQLSAKADPNAQDSSGWTALMYATRAPQPDAIKILLDAGANPNLRSYMGQTALMAATSAFNSPLEKLRLLIAARGDINAQDNDGHTALMFAMYGSVSSEGRQFLERAESISLMREAGAGTDLRDGSGLTVFDYLDRETGPYPNQKSQSEKIRQILQNPSPGVYPPVKVSGRVSSSSGERPYASSIEFQRVGVGVAAVRAAVGADGSFEFPSVVPGPYAVSLAPAPSFTLPAIPLVVSNNDVTGLDIAIPAVKEVNVRVAVEGDAPAPNFALIFVAVSGAAASSGPPASIPQDLVSIIPPNIQKALVGGAAGLQLIRMGISPLVDDSTLRIALPYPWASQNVSVANPLSDGSFRMSLPEGDYQAAAILPRLFGGLPRIYTVKSVTAGSTDLLSQPLRITGTEPVEIRATFSTTIPGPWRKLSGRVVGIEPGTEGNFKVVLSGEVLATLLAPIQPDGSFEFPMILQGSYIARVAPHGMEATAGTRPRTASDNVIRVTDRNVTGIAIAVPR